jgi:hypothetical protein
MHHHCPKRMIIPIAADRSMQRSENEIDQLDRMDGRRRTDLQSSSRSHAVARSSIYHGHASRL